MLKVVAIIAIGLVAVSAATYHNPRLAWKAERVEIRSNSNLNEFVRAWKEGDKGKIVQMIDLIDRDAESCEDSTYEDCHRLVNQLDWIERLVSEVEKSSPEWMTDGTIRKMSSINNFMEYIDERDEFNYDLETVLKWISKRQDAGVDDERLSSALAALKESKAALKIIVEEAKSTLEPLRGDNITYAVAVIRGALRNAKDKRGLCHRGPARAREILIRLRGSIEPKFYDASFSPFSGFVKTPEFLAALAEQNSSKNINELVEAWNNNHRDKIAELLEFIVFQARDCHGLAVASALKYNRILSYMNMAYYEAESTELVELFERVLRHYGQSEETFYICKASIQWISRIQDAGVRDERLSTALTNLKDSQVAGKKLNDTMEATMELIRQKRPPALDTAMKKILDQSGSFIRGPAKAYNILKNLRDSFAPHPMYVAWDDTSFYSEED